MPDLLQVLGKLTPVYGIGELARSPLTGDAFDLGALTNAVVWLAVFVTGTVYSSAVTPAAADGPTVKDASTTTDPGRLGVPDRRGARPLERGWFVGASLSLIWVFPSLVSVWEEPGPPARSSAPAWSWSSLRCSSVGSVPFVRRTSSVSLRLVPAVVLWGLSLALLPWPGTDVRWLWTFVGVSVAVFPPVGYTRMLSTRPEPQCAVVRRGRVERSGSAHEHHQLGDHPVDLDHDVQLRREHLDPSSASRRSGPGRGARGREERGRVARDVHDILGHSLTVITVKAELAGRLMDAGSPAARQEIAQIEQLSRGALADVRATVHGYRGVSISGELAAARAALDSAGVSAEAPFPGTPTRSPPTGASSPGGWSAKP